MAALLSVAEKTFRWIETSPKLISSGDVLRRASFVSPTLLIRPPFQEGVPDGRALYCLAHESGHRVQDEQFNLLLFGALGDGGDRLRAEMRRRGPAAFFP